MCSCGCGFWASETQGLDENGEPHDSGEWTVVEDTCYARKALDEHLDGVEKRPPGQILFIRPSVSEAELAALGLPSEPPQVQHHRAERQQHQRREGPASLG